MTMNNHHNPLDEKTPESVEMGEKLQLELNMELEASNHLMGENNSQPHTKDNSSEKKAGPAPVGITALAGSDDLVYDDADWKSDVDDDVAADGGDENAKRKDGSTENVNILSKAVLRFQTCVNRFAGLVDKVFCGHFWDVVKLLGYLAYFVLAMTHSTFDDEASWRLIICTIIGVIVITRHRVAWLAKRMFQCINGGERLNPRNASRWKKIKWVFKWFMNIALFGFMLYVLLDVGLKDIENLRSLPGLVLFLLVCLLVSANPMKIDWYVIYWSMGLQFLFAMLALRGQWGRNSIMWVQGRLAEFFENSESACKFLFGESYKDHYVIFGGFPIIFMANATLVLLYYLGAMQIVTKVIGAALQWVLGTSLIECVSVSGGIFLEGGVMVLILRPYLGALSKSEMFVVITSGLASLGGTYVAILSTVGVSLEYVIPAMLVSAPATFAVCKLMVPENLDSRKKDKGESIDWSLMGGTERGRYTNVVDALQGGASSVVGLLGCVVAVTFVFYSYLSWFNHTLEWFGDRVGIEKLTIELIFSYLLYPVALAMGVHLQDCTRVAMLLGYRIGSNNVIAFFKLVEMKGNKAAYMKYMADTNFTGPISTYRDDITLDLWNQTLPSGFLTDRSEAIITYCLCGFSSAMSVGVFMIFMYTLVPRRRKWLTKMTLPALLAGNVANCMTGCFASIFY